MEDMDVFIICASLIARIVLIKSGHINDVRPTFTKMLRESSTSLISSRHLCYDYPFLKAFALSIKTYPLIFLLNMQFSLY